MISIVELHNSYTCQHGIGMKYILYNVMKTRDLHYNRIKDHQVKEFTNILVDQVKYCKII